MLTHVYNLDWINDFIYFKKNTYFKERFIFLQAWSIAPSDVDLLLWLKKVRRHQHQKQPLYKFSVCYVTFFPLFWQIYFNFSICASRKPTNVN